MKSFKKLAQTALLAGLLASAALGLDKFQSLDKPFENEQNTIIETFSFWCGGCYHHHELGTLAKIKEKLPNFTYKIYPLTEVPFGEEFSRLYAYAQSEDEAAGLDATQKNSAMHKLADAYFVAIFKRKINYTDSRTFTKLGLKTLGISQKELDEFVKSPKGQRIYKDYNKASVVTEAYGATPSFTINGKYFLLLQDIRGLDEMVEVIKDASKK